MASTPNVQIVHAGASIPSEPMKYYSPSFRKTCYKKCRKKFSSSSAKISYDLNSLVIDHIPGCKFPIRVHPFMTSTRRGSGSGGRMWTGRGSSPMWTSTQKIKIRVHRRHTVFFSCKEVGVFFTRISSLNRKKWKSLCDIN